MVLVIFIPHELIATQTQITLMASQLACCGIKFGWFDELVAHCQEAHTVQATQAGSPASEHESTQQSDSEDLDVELYEDYDGSDFEKYTQRAKRGAPVKVSKIYRSVRYFAKLFNDT